MTLIALIPVVIILCFGAWRAALIVLGAALVLDLLIALLRVGARAALEEGVFSLRILAGPIKLKLLPKEETEKPEPEEPGEEKKKPKKPKKAKKAKKAKKGKKGEPGETAGGEEKKKELPVKITVELISTVLNAVGELLGRLRRKISIDRLTVHYTVASEDPASAAMTYGYASAGISALMPVIENIFKVRERDVGVAVTFERSEGDFYIDAQLTLAIWEILYIAFAVWPVVKAVIAQYMNKRKVDKNGQSSDQ